MDKLFKDIANAYLSCGNIRQVADNFGINYNKVRKILVTMNVYKSEKGDCIRLLYDNGASIKYIMKVTKLSRSSVDTYLPYKRGPKFSDSPTKNALKIRACREKKKKV